MFIELTEIVKEGLHTYASKPKERPIYLNVDKIQAIHPSSNNCCVIEMRRESIEVREDYETVKENLRE